MSGFCRSFFIFLYILSVVYGQSNATSNDCDESLESVYGFMSRLSTVDIEAGDRLAYDQLNEEYSKTKEKINNAKCAQEKKDSLAIKLTAFFSKKVVKAIGDLPQYIALLDDIRIKCDSIITARIFEYMSVGDVFYKGHRDAYTRENERLAKEYGELVIAFDKSQRLTSMGVVRNKITYNQVEIHIRPPQSMNDQDEKQKRLSFIQSTFKLDFSEPDPEAGYIKRIEYFPKAFSSGIRTRDQHILDSYAFTFDKTKRYRTKMTDGEFDTLYIKKLVQWELIKQTPPNTAIILLPKGLEYGDPKVSETTRTDIMDEKESKVYLRPGIDNVEITIVDDSFNDKLYLAIRFTVITAVTIIPILFL